MNKANCLFTLFFDDPFWVAVIERESGGRLTACKVIFGAEPTDAEIYDFVLTRYNRLVFSPPVAAPDRKPADNPKRRKRLAARRMNERGVGTRSQMALQVMREAAKQEKKAKSKQELEAEAQRRFALKQQKKKAKHKGR